VCYRWIFYVLAGKDKFLIYRNSNPEFLQTIAVSVDRLRVDLKKSQVEMVGNLLTDGCIDHARSSLPVLGV
jgi:hypothetical protein